MEAPWTSEIHVRMNRRTTVKQPGLVGPRSSRAASEGISEQRGGITIGDATIESSCSEWRQGQGVGCSRPSPGPADALTRGPGRPRRIGVLVVCGISAAGGRPGSTSGSCCRGTCRSRLACTRRHRQKRRRDAPAGAPRAALASLASLASPQGTRARCLLAAMGTFDRGQAPAEGGRCRSSS